MAQGSVKILKPIDVLLIYPPFSHVLFGDDDIKAEAAPPLGVNYLHAFLKKEGLASSLSDMNIKMYCESGAELKYLWKVRSKHLWTNEKKFFNIVIPALGESIERYVQDIHQAGPQLICLSVNVTSKLFSCYLARKIKEKNNKSIIVFGGPECMPHNAKHFIMDQGVDVVVIGEGEQTLVELVRMLKESGKLSQCPGAFVKMGDSVVYGGNRELIKNLDSLPVPDFTDTIGHYSKMMNGKPVIPISWLRGCTNQCAFCYESFLWKTARGRSPEAICDEFECQSKKYNTILFEKVDSTLGISEDQISRVCDLLLQRKIRVIWGGFARVENYLTFDLLKKMCAAGCKQLYFGIESGSQKVIDSMKKNFSIRKAGEVLKASKRAGIVNTVYIMYNYPGETIVDLMRTIWFLLKNKKYIDYADTWAFGVVLSPLFIAPTKYDIIIDQDGDWHTKKLFDSPFMRRVKGVMIRSFLNLVYKNSFIS